MGVDHDIRVRSESHDSDTSVQSAFRTRTDAWPDDLARLMIDAKDYECVISDSNQDAKVFRQDTSDPVLLQDMPNQDKILSDRSAKLTYTTEKWSDDSASDASSPDSALVALPAEGSSCSPVESSTSINDTELDPEEIIRLICDEFGTLAKDGEEEKLLLEVDAALFQDILIAGVVHLTSHRFTFHASILAARPDLKENEQVLKAGTVVIHRRGLHRRRRLWLELSHDLLCLYDTSDESEHLKPIRTIMLNKLHLVMPIDKDQPRLVRLQYGAEEGSVETIFAEFSTEESAAGWKKEIQAAILADRQRRNDAFTKPDEDGGIRISIPYDRIASREAEDCFGFLKYVTFFVPLTEDDVRKFDAPVAEQCIRFVILNREKTWEQLTEAINSSKQKYGVDNKSPVIVDFGRLSFVKPQDQENNGRQLTDLQMEERALRDVLALGDGPIWMTRARVHRGITSYGFIAISEDGIVGFWSRAFSGRDVIYRIYAKMIKSARPTTSRFSRYSSLKIEIDAHEDLAFDFSTAAARDEAVSRIKAAADEAHKIPSILDPHHLVTPMNSPALFTTTKQTAWLQKSLSESDADYFATELERRSRRSTTELLSPISRVQSVTLTRDARLPTDIKPFIQAPINYEPRSQIIVKSLHFCCLTIGSRGDVQPYIALGKGLMAHGHKVTIVTHEEYKKWVTGFGIGHRSAGGDPGALMKLSVENKMFSPEFFRESLTNFRSWLDELLVEAWEQCQDADVLLESPSAMAGVHIAEALQIPYFRTFTMPWTATSAFPHAFLSPPIESPTFNKTSYIIFDNIFWTATSGQINRWRRKHLKLEATDMGHLAQSQIPFIYNFSPSVVPKPLDWSDSITVSGYWFLDNPDLDWIPPPSLITWMDKARQDKKAIVYIGFGSITVPNPSSITKKLIAAVLKSDVRAIISKGWSSRMSKDTEAEPDYPPECYPLQSVPHDWLFPQIDVAMHHGGAGTTGASLRAGIPTLIKPWFGDQFFWASRVQKLGAGLRINNIKIDEVADALRKASTSTLMRERAARVGARIRKENGVETAITAMYTYMPRAAQERSH